LKGAFQQAADGSTNASELRLWDDGLAGITLKKIADDLAQASALPRGAGEDSSMDVRRHSNRDPWSMFTRSSVEWRTSAASLPAGQVETPIDLGGQPLDVVLGQHPPASRLHDPWHRITPS
jgi:hypothetical protein